MDAAWVLWARREEWLPEWRAGAAILVEGASDAAAVVVLARRSGIALEHAVVVVLEGVTNVGAAARALRAASPRPRLLAVCDAREERFVRAALGDDDSAAWFVCDRDLEDELLRAIGPEGVERLLAEQDELDSFRRFQRQPAQQGRDRLAQLHRFMGTKSGRKHRYGAILATAVGLDRTPTALADLLAALGA